MYANKQRITGKTTVALYAKFLSSIGVLKSGYIKETSGAKLASKDPADFKHKLKRNFITGRGGVLFIDEAYQLVSPHASVQGKRILDLILKIMEDTIGKMAVIFVGYKDEMEAFFEHNPDLSSRIPWIIDFPNFNEAELWNVLHSYIKKQYHDKMNVESGFDGLPMQIAIRRLAESSGGRDFGNARAVENLLVLIARRQSQRLIEEGRDPSPKYDFCTNPHSDYLFFTKIISDLTRQKQPVRALHG